MVEQQFRAVGVSVLLRPQDDATPVGADHPPGEWGRVVVISSDATPTVLGAMDWTNKFAFRAEVAHIRQWVTRVLTDRDLAEEGDSLQGGCERGGLPSLGGHRALWTMLPVVIDAAAFQVEEWTQGRRLVKDFETVARDLGANPFIDQGHLRMLCGSVGPDPYGKRLIAFLQAAKRAEVVVALVEGPRLAAWEQGERRCQCEGWHYGLVTSEFGEGLARRRRGLVVQLEGEKVDWGMALVKTEAPVPATTMLTSVG